MKTLNRSFFCIILVVTTLAISGFKEDIGTLQYYKGVIAYDTNIQLSIQLEDTQVNGSFIYEESGEVLVLIGQIVKSSQSVTLDVVNDSDVNIAQIQARYYTNELDEIVTIKGRYLDINTNKSRAIKLDKLAEYVAKVKVSSDYQ